MIEVKKIPGYENYECDIFGNVWTLNYARRGERKKLKPHKTKKGYLRVCLCKNKKPIHLLVHRIIMLTFHGERPEKLQVNHIDGNKKNNNFLNLEYVTAKENIKHAWQTGLRKVRLGEKKNSSKLKRKEVIEIKKELLNYTWGMCTTLGMKYGVTSSTISGIRKGRNWSHIII